MFKAIDIFGSSLDQETHDDDDVLFWRFHFVLLRPSWGKGGFAAEETEGDAISLLGVSSDGEFLASAAWSVIAGATPMPPSRPMLDPFTFSSLPSSAVHMLMNSLEASAVWGHAELSLGRRFMPPWMCQHSSSPEIFTWKPCQFEKWQKNEGICLVDCKNPKKREHFPSSFFSSFFSTSCCFRSGLLTSSGDKPSPSR